MKSEPKNSIRGPFPPMTEHNQAREWIRNIQLARAHFDAFQRLHEAYDRVAAVSSTEGAFLLLCYQALRNSVIIHMAAAMDRSAGAISVRRLAENDLVAKEAITALEQGTLVKRIEFVRNKTIGHRSASHSNNDAWAAARLEIQELEGALGLLEQIKDRVAMAHQITPYITAYGSAEGLAALIETVVSDDA